MFQYKRQLRRCQNNIFMNEIFQRPWIYWSIFAVPVNATHQYTKSHTPFLIVADIVSPCVCFTCKACRITFTYHIHIYYIVNAFLWSGSRMVYEKSVHVSVYAESSTANEETWRRTNNDEKNNWEHIEQNELAILGRTFLNFFL